MKQDPRYSSHWNDTKNFHRALSLDTCCLCMCPQFFKSVQVHHLYYGVRIIGFIHLHIPGCEIPLWQLINVCDRCHGKLHSNDLFARCKNPWDNRQRFMMAMYLRLRMLIAMGLIWGGICFAVYYVVKEML